MKPQVEVVDVTQCRKDISVEIAAAEVKAEFELAYDAFARHAPLPGFRPGRTPRTLIKQRFGKQAMEEVTKKLVKHAVDHIFEDYPLRIVSELEISELQVVEGEPLRFKLSFEVMPKFELRQYLGLKAIRFLQRVTDQSVDLLLERFRESLAQFFPIADRPSQLGDFVVVNLSGKQVEPPTNEDLNEEINDEGVRIELGGPGTHQQFTESLLATQAGDGREFRLGYPADFPAAKVAGKTFDFRAAVTAVQRKELPEWNDDLARKYSYASLPQMRRRVRADLEKLAEREADEHLRGQLIQQLLAAHDFEVPDVFVEKQAVQRTRELIQQLIREGRPPESAKTIDWDQQIEAEWESATVDVRRALLIEKIGHAEGITVGEDEVDDQIVRLAIARHEPYEVLKARLTKEEAISSIESQLRFQKIINFLVENADITVTEITDNQATEPASIT